MTSSIEMARADRGGAPTRFGYVRPDMGDAGAMAKHRSGRIASPPGMRALIAPGLVLLAAVAVAVLLHARSSGIF